MKSLILAAMILMAGCNDMPESNVKKVATVVSISPVSNVSYNVYLYEIDSCEYIGSLMSGSSSTLAHKGNCKFCKARQLLMNLIPDNKTVPHDTRIVRGLAAATAFRDIPIEVGWCSKTVCVPNLKT